MEKIVGRSARTRWAGTMVASLCFVAGGVFILATSDNTVIGLSGIVFFGGCALVAVAQLLDARPRLVIDGRGVFDRTLKIGVIEWHDIDGAFVKPLHGNAFICLDLRDPVKYTGRLSSLGRRLSTLNRSLGFTDVCLNLAGTDLDADRVCELLLKEATARGPGFRNPAREAGSS